MNAESTDDVEMEAAEEEREETVDEEDNKLKIVCHICHELFLMPSELNDHVAVDHPNAFQDEPQFEFVDLCSCSEEESGDENETSEDEASEDESSDESVDIQQLLLRIDAAPNQHQNDGQSTSKVVDIKSISTEQFEADASVSPDSNRRDNITQESGLKSHRNDLKASPKKRKKSKNGKRHTKRRCCLRNNDGFEAELLVLENHVESVAPESLYLDEFRLSKMREGFLCCSYCSFTCMFGRQAILYRHVACVHMKTFHKENFMIEGNICRICGGKFESVNGLLTHLGSVHRMVPKEVADSIARSKLERKFALSLENEAEMTEARSDPTNEMNYWSCFLCPKNPTSSHSLVSHLITHFKDEVIKIKLFLFNLQLMT